MHKTYNMLPSHAPSHHQPRARHPPSTAIQRRCSRDNKLAMENLQGATAAAEESLTCLRNSHFQCKNLDRLVNTGPIVPTGLYFSMWQAG